MELPVYPKLLSGVPPEGINQQLGDTETIVVGPRGWTVVTPSQLYALGKYLKLLQEKK